VYKKLERRIAMCKNRGLALNKGWLQCVYTIRCNSIPGGKKKNFEVQNVLMMNGRNRMVGKGNRWSWEREQWKNLSIGERDTDKVIKL